MKYLFLAQFLFLAINPLFASEGLIDSETLDIDGQLAPARPRPTAADRIRVLRKQLEERNEQMVRKKIEDMRIKSELELMHKLQETFNRQISAIDNIK